MEDANGSPEFVNEAETIYTSLYRAEANKVSSWIKQAHRHNTVANLLKERVEAGFANLSNEGQEWRQIYLLPNYLMTMGFAFENLFKGIMVLLGRQPVKKTSEEKPMKLEKAFKTHELVTLAERAGFKIDSDERKLLARISSFSVWAGRYPIPEREKKDVSHKGNARLLKADLDRASSLFSRATRDLVERVRDPEERLIILASLGRTDEAIASYQKSSEHGMTAS